MIGRNAKKIKDEMITFKVDRSLHRAMKGIPNRSHFIRESLLSALQNACPICRGSGILSPDQKRHWDQFAEAHELKECRQCSEILIQCRKSSRKAEEKAGGRNGAAHG